MTGGGSTELESSAAALLRGAVDYAGLFPPAGLSMAEALREYAAAAADADAWMLARFVVPASRLVELRAQARGDRPLPLSVIVTDGSEPERAAVADLATHASPAIVVDAIECKPTGIQSLDWLAQAFGGVDVYVEIDPSSDVDTWFARLAERGLRAKIRTGGTVATAFPAPSAVIAFMAAALRARVPFKATAGLHHAIRGSYRLTYQPDSGEAVMYGYLNVLLAAATLRAGHSLETAERVLTDSDAASLRFEPGMVRWRNRSEEHTSELQSH